MMRLAIIGVVAGMALGMLINLPYGDWFFPPEPYSEITIHDSGPVVDNPTTVDPHEGDFRLHATFLKNECEFQYMAFHGKLFDKWTLIPYVDEDPKGDRIAGWHTFDVYAQTDGVKYETIELRTRHFCPEIIDGKEVNKTVDKVFYTVSVT